MRSVSFILLMSWLSHVIITFVTSFLTKRVVEVCNLINVCKKFTFLVNINKIYLLLTVSRKNVLFFHNLAGK